MIQLLQTMYNTRDITNFETATRALNLIAAQNDFNQFKT